MSIYFLGFQFDRSYSSRPFVNYTIEWTIHPSDMDPDQLGEALLLAGLRISI